MAGEWIKMQTNLPDKPEVWHMAGQLAIDADSVVGKLLRVWAWFDSHTEDGNAHGVSFPLIDRVAGVAGFAEAMFLAGWLEQNGTVLTLPNFARHNGKTAKNRALTNERVAKHRQINDLGNDDSGNAGTVTKTVTREEKRREEGNTPQPSRGRVSEFPPGFDAFWSAYPRKTAKPKAAQAFARIRPDADLLARMLAAVAQQAGSEQWLKDGGQFIPHPASWLNARRWEDEAPRRVADDPFAGAA